MTAPRVIQADYANWRPVAGRKVLQLTFEVPIEQTEQVMKMLGVPMPGESKWCAIALLEQKSGEATANDPEVGGDEGANVVSRPSATATGVKLSGPATNSKAPRPFASLPLSQQAAIRTGDKSFRDFLETQTPIHDQESYADAVRAICGVESRSDIRPGTPAAIAWMALEAKYQNWLTDRRYAEAARASR